MSFTLSLSPFLSPLLGDEELLALFSVEADLSSMLRFEVALAAAQAKLGFIPAKTAYEIAAGISDFLPDRQQLASGISRDGMAIPELVSQLKMAGHPKAHFGATSQDVIDTSLMMRAKAAFAILSKRLEGLAVELERLAKQFGGNTLVARTRMQQALPFKVSDRIAVWIEGLLQAQTTLSDCHFPLQLGGPIGILAEFGDRASTLKSEVAERLGLEVRADNWHTLRAPIVALGNAASQLTGALGKIGMDYCLMAQNELAEVKLSGGGTSSAMHHKQNPVLAETLVTLARFNAVQISGLHHSMVHEQERSGAAWTLEWMILPHMMAAAGASTLRCVQLLQSTTEMGQS